MIQANLALNAVMYAVAIGQAGAFLVAEVLLAVAAGWLWMRSGSEA